jgi:hypothetical protein
MVREIQVTIDCADPGALARFWAEALGYRLQEPPGGFGSWDEALAAMGVPEERRNDASAVGARRLHRVEPDPPLGAGHIVMADPEGNEFCLD